MLKYFIIQFIIVLFVSYILNGGYLLLYSLDDYYFIYIYIYIALITTSNTLWIHQIIEYLLHNRINKYLLIIGLVLSIIFFFVLRKQIYIDKKQLLKSLIIKNSSTNFEITEFLKKNKVLDRDLENLLNDIIVNNVNNKEKFLKIINN